MDLKSLTNFFKIHFMIMIIFNQPCLSFGSSFVGPPNVSHGKLWGFINSEIPNPIKISQGIHTYGLQKKINKKK